jgi:hypothetical protein
MCWVDAGLHKGLCIKCLSSYDAVFERSENFSFVLLSGMSGKSWKYCYVLEWCLLSDATMQTDGLSATPHNNAVGHYYERDNVHVERLFYSYELLQFVDTLREKDLLKGEEGVCRES